MRKLFLIMLLFFLAGCDLGMQSYQHKKYNFSLLIPRGWYVEEDTPEGMALVVKEKMRSEQDRFQESIVVVVKELVPPIALDILYDINKEKIMEIVPGEKYNFSDEFIFSSLGKGKCLCFNDKLEKDLELKVRSCLWVRANQMYVISATCDQKEARHYEKRFKKIMQSLAYKK